MPATTDRPLIRFAAPLRLCWHQLKSPESPMLHLILRIHAECAADEASTRVVQRRLLEALAPWNATPRFAIVC